MDGLRTKAEAFATAAAYGTVFVAQALACEGRRDGTLRSAGFSLRSLGIRTKAEASATEGRGRTVVREDERMRRGSWTYGKRNSR